MQDTVAADCHEWGIREVGYDKRFAQQMALHLQGEGITMVDTAQGFQLTEAIKKMLELISACRNEDNKIVGEGLLAHGGDPILAWMAGNAQGQHGRDGQIRLDKEASGEKIDGMSALATAISRWIVQPEDETLDRAIIVVGDGAIRNDEQQPPTTPSQYPGVGPGVEVW